MKTRHYALLAAVVACAAGAQDRPAPPRQPAAACLAPAAWYTLASDVPRRVPAEDVLRDAAGQRVVLLGEQHDRADHHVWQLQTLAALQVLRPQLVIGFESFPRHVQPVLDRWIAGELTTRQFLEQSEWEKVWNYPPELYLPLFEFARLNRIPMIALNVKRTLTEAIGRRGWDAVPAEEKEGVSRPAAAPAAYEDMLFEVFQDHSRGRQGTGRRDPAFRHFVESQTTWDRAMAEALAASARAPANAAPPLVVGIMGGGHVRMGHGVPHQLRDLGVQEIATLLPADATGPCSALKPGLADAVFAALPAPREPAPPPRLGIQLGSTDGSVEITSVTSGSLAERSGLQRGDRIVSLAGTPVKNMATVVAAVRAQPPGTWLPLQVRRGEETLDMVVRFPPRS